MTPDNPRSVTTSEHDQPVLREWLAKGAAHFSQHADDYHKRLAWACGRGGVTIAKMAAQLDVVVNALEFIADGECPHAEDGTTCHDDDQQPEDRCEACLAQGALEAVGR